MTMTRRDVAFTMMMLLMLGMVAAAGLTTWLLLTAPMTAVSAFDAADITPLLQAAVGAFYTALSFLGRFL
jgi:hypothetical protein